MSYDQALERAAAEKKPILIDFSGRNCVCCFRMKRDVFPRPEVVAILREFVPLKLYLDMVPISSIPHEERARLAKINQDRLRRLDPAGRNPLYLVLSPRGEVIETSSGYQEGPRLHAVPADGLGEVPRDRQGRRGQWVRQAGLGRPGNGSEVNRR